MSSCEHDDRFGGILNAVNGCLQCEFEAQRKRHVATLNDNEKLRADVERLRKATKLALGALRMWRDVDAIAILSEVEGS